MTIRSLPFVIVILLAACGDDASDDASGDDTGSGAASQGGGTGEGGAMAPLLDEVEPMHGALHLNWTNASDDCDSADGERKRSIDAAFSPLFSVPGTVDNKADDEATDAMVVYTYRLRCKKSEAYSAYSNEVSASPMP